jgi:hypothetical protein
MNFREICNRALSRLGCMLVLVCAGCDGGAAPRLNSSVEGQVTLDGIPLAGVLIQFFPEGNLGIPGSNSITDDKGFFKLTCDNGDPGAAVCKHKVVVLPGRNDDRGGSRYAPQAPPANVATTTKKKNPPIPVSYTLATKSPLNIEVTEGKHSYDLSLKSRQ